MIKTIFKTFLFLLVLSVIFLSIGFISKNEALATLSCSKVSSSVDCQCLPPTDTSGSCTTTRTSCSASQNSACQTSCGGGSFWCSIATTTCNWSCTDYTCSGCFQQNRACGSSVGSCVNSGTATASSLCNSACSGTQVCAGCMLTNTTCNSSGTCVANSLAGQVASSTCNYTCTGTWCNSATNTICGQTCNSSGSCVNNSLTCTSTSCGGTPSPVCGDGTCNGTETCSSCSTDCGTCPVTPVCGDGACNGSETCSTCSTDCGTCPVASVCGDGTCNGSETCSTCSTDCGACPIITYSITGNVYIDTNGNGSKDTGEANYTGATVTLSTGPSTTTNTSGNYTFSNLTSGTYTVTITVPSGYVATTTNPATTPVTGPTTVNFGIRVPPCTPTSTCSSQGFTCGSFTDSCGNVQTCGTCTAGQSCSNNSGGVCTNGNITNLKFGITNSIPWIQTTGGDPYFGGGFTNTIPQGASCGPYMSLRGGGGTPGIVYCGSGSCNSVFGSGQASQNPYNWQVGGETYSGKLKTSYNTLYSTAVRSGITPTDIAPYCTGGISNCALSTSLPNGVYVANGNLTLAGASYTFLASKNFVILVNGDLNINTEIHVPIGSTAIFSASGNINVGSNVGNANSTITCDAITHAGCNIEGYFSADKNFTVLHDSTKTCPASDLRLNAAGSIVVNASLTGGSFVNQRDLCSGDTQCPVFSVTERPDFVLNSPSFLMSARRIWQEIAP